MNYLSVGDMAQSYQLRNHSAKLKQTLTILSEEMVTGKISDIGDAVKGDFRSLSAIDTSLNRLNSLNINAKQADIYASTMQTALQKIQDRVKNSGATLLTASSDISNTALNIAVADATEDFNAIISILNTNVSGRYIFSGCAATVQPVTTPETILSALETAVAGSTTVEEILNYIDNWFSAPSGSGGFFDIAYMGSQELTSNILISESDSIDLPITAANDTIRETLKNFATIALIGRNSLPIDNTIEVKIVRAISEGMITSESDLAEMSGMVGITQSRISEAQALNTNEITSLNLARAGIVDIDDYETATAIEAVKTQLEILYSLTADISGMSLMDYI